MDPDRQVVRGDRREERPEARLVERMAGDVGEGLHAPRAHLDGAVHLGDGEIDVVQVDRRGERRKAVRMFRDKLGHRIVGDLGEIVGDRALGDVLDRRVGQRDDLPVVACRSRPCP